MNTDYRRVFVDHVAITKDDDMYEIVNRVNNPFTCLDHNNKIKYHIFKKWMKDYGYSPENGFSRKAA